VFGSLGAWFITGLARDVRRLETHAWQVVRGERGVHLRVERRDELGQLMHAVNHMSVDLDEREKQIELDAERRSHQDKMLTVAAVAAGVAHEVNNPLAVISAVAQELQAAEGLIEPRQLAESARQILEQVDRAALASRQLADVAAPQPEELDWVDLNSLVRRAVQLMGYDRRYRSMQFGLELDGGLMALRTSASAVQQVLMQLLTLGCDAAGSVGNPGQAVQLATHAVDGGVCVTMAFPPAFDPADSEVQRSLLLVRATLKGLGGRLALEQEASGRKRVQLTLPDAGGHRI
jgi:signal transduction histidine kinase